MNIVLNQKCPNIYAFSPRPAAKFARIRADSFE